MKIELHLHTDRYSACATASPVDMLHCAESLGYECVFLTEHDEVWPDEHLRELRSQFPLLTIFGGVERTITNDRGFCHLLILGTSDETFLEMQEPGAILARARRQQCLTVLAHPYRWEGASEMLNQGFFPDALEYHTPNHESALAGLSAATAEKLALPLVNTSDAHGPDFLGRFWVETRDPIHSPADLRRAICNGQYENQLAPAEALRRD